MIMRKPVIVKWLPVLLLIGLVAFGLLMFDADSAIKREPPVLKLKLVTSLAAQMTITESLLTIHCGKARGNLVFSEEELTEMLAVVEKSRELKQKACDLFSLVDVRAS